MGKDGKREEGSMTDDHKCVMCYQIDIKGGGVAQKTDSQRREEV